MQTLETLLQKFLACDVMTDDELEYLNNELATTIYQLEQFGDYMLLTTKQLHIIKYNIQEMLHARVNAK